MRSVSVMEWNFNTPSEWDWENLSMYSGRETEISKHGQHPDNETEGNVVVDNGSIYSSGGRGFSNSALGHGSLYTNSVAASVNSSSRDRTNTYGNTDDFSKDACETEEFSWMGKNGNFPEMVEAAMVSKTKSLSVTPTTSSPSQIKRSRASYHNTSPRCQVEGCSLDLVSAKDYHRRHRICESHSKSPKVIVAGMERRFCQQCSRFHGLSEFDDKKRSCRRRLSDHNARRRRPQTEGIRFVSTPLSSSIYGRRSKMNFFMNRFHLPVSNPTWESSGFKVTLAGESLFSLSKGGDIYRKSHSSNDVSRNAISTLNLNSDRSPLFQGVAPQVLNHGILESRVTSNSVVAPEVRRAFSLLSTSSWGLNESESTSLNHFGHEYDISLAQLGMPSELQNWGLFPSEYVQVEQTTSQPRTDKLDFQNIGFSSNQIN